MSGARRAQGDDGVAIVEMALVLPILVVLMLGMFTGALAWNQSQALGQGARVAARYASTLPLPATADLEDEWADDLIDRVVASSEGQLDAGVPGRAVCVAYVDPNGALEDQTFSRRLDATGNRTDGTSWCFDDEQGDSAQRVQVLVERDSHIDTGFYRYPLTLRRQVVYRYEATDGL